MAMERTVYIIRQTVLWLFAFTVNYASTLTLWLLFVGFWGAATAELMAIIIPFYGDELRDFIYSLNDDMKRHEEAIFFQTAIWYWPMALLFILFYATEGAPKSKRRRLTRSERRMILNVPIRPFEKDPEKERQSALVSPESGDALIALVDRIGHRSDVVHQRHLVAVIKLAEAQLSRTSSLFNKDREFMVLCMLDEMVRRVGEQAVIEQLFDGRPAKYRDLRLRLSSTRD